MGGGSWVGIPLRSVPQRGPTRQQTVYLPGTCVKLRGLPYDAAPPRVADFLGCKVERVALLHNKTYG